MRMRMGWGIDRGRAMGGEKREKGMTMSLSVVALLPPTPLPPPFPSSLHDCLLDRKGID